MGKKICVSFFGGPGCGKSTMAAHVFAELKWLKVNCELVPEYAKEKVWEKSFYTLTNQRLVYGKQHHMLCRVLEHVDVAITDSPLLLSAIYAKKEDKKLVELVIEDYKKFNTINILLIRKKEYNPIGRMQTEKEAIEKDIEIENMLKDNNILYSTIEGKRENVKLIVDKINMCLEGF